MCVCVCCYCCYFCCVIAELFNERRADLCRCPVECEVTNYRSSKSYAAVAKDDNRKFALTDEYTFTMQKMLKESIDAKEHVENREHNWWLITSAMHEYTYLFNAKSVSDIKKESYDMCYDFNLNYWIFLTLILDPMKFMLLNRFLLPWDVINFDTTLASSNNLYQVINRSKIHKGSWRSAVQVRLEEHREAAVITHEYFERLHAAFLDGDGLFYNGKLDRYDQSRSMYVKVATFNTSETANEIFDRVSKHFQDYVSNIDALLQMSNCSDEYVDENYIESYMRNASGFHQIVVEYVNDMRLFKRFIIEKPVERVETVTKKIEEYMKEYDLICKQMRGSLSYAAMLIDKLEQYADIVSRDGTYSTLMSYKYSLSYINKSVSMTDLARNMSSKSLFRSMEDASGLMYDAMLKMQIFARFQKELHDHNCATMTFVMSEPLLTEMSKHLDPTVHHVDTSVQLTRMIVMATEGTFHCDEWREPENIFGQASRWLSLKDVSALQRKLTSLLEQSQLNGAFYR